MAWANGSASLAMGASATAFGDQSIAIGSTSPVTLAADGTHKVERTRYDGHTNTQTNGNRSLALGSNAKTNGDDSFAVGTNSRTGYFQTGKLANGDNGVVANTAKDADEAIAFGNNASALDDKAIAFGNNATARDNRSIAFGINATTNGSASVAIGTDSKAEHERVVTIGTNSTATHNRSMAVGEDARALANHSLALGASARVEVENSVSLGADSYADEIGGQEEMTINGRTYKFAGLQPKGTVSIGSGYDNDQAREGTTVRTITDLGAGRVLANSTDAINGSQLYAIATELGKGWNLSTNATAEGSKTGDSNAANVINGETVTFTAGKNIAINQNDQNITVATKDNVTFTSVTTNDLSASGNTSLGNLTVKPGSTINMGNNRITNVGTPTADTDATNKKYVDDGRTQVTSPDGSVTVNKTTANGANVYELKVNANVNYAGDTGSGTNKLSDPIKFAGTADEVVTKAENGKVTIGLADKAKESLDKADTALQAFTVGADKAHTAAGIEVNQTTKRFDIIGTDDYVTTKVTDGSIQVDIDQKFKDTVANNTKNIANNTQNIANNTQNITNNANAIAKGFGLEAQDGNNVNKQLGENVKLAGGNDNINTTVKDGEVKINLNNTLNLTENGSINLGNTNLNNDGLTINNGPSITQAGINAGDKKVTNVSNGTIDATSQDAVNGSQLYATNQNVTNNTQNINNLNNTVQAGWELQAEGQKVKDVTPNNKTANFKAGDNIVVSDDNGSIKIATKQDVTFDNITTNSSLTVKNGADINMGDNVVNGVANGTISNDSKQAVNGSQLFATNQNITNLTNRVDGGFGLTAQDGQSVTKQLGEKVDIIGGNQNLNTTVVDGKVVINLNNTLNLTENGSINLGNTSLNNNGLTITDGPSITQTGINAGDKKITNVTAGTADTDAVNVSQLEKVNATANAGWNLQANGNNGSTVTPNATVSLDNTDGNIIITKEATDNNVTFALNSDLTLGGKDGKDGSIGVKGADGKDGVTITKDALVFNGIDGVNGKDGQDGADGSASIKVEKGAKGLDGNDGKDGESKTRIVYEKPNGETEEVATLNDGLYFKGDVGDSIAKKLNETLSIKGNLAADAAVTDKNLRVDNVNGELILKMAKSLVDLTNATFGSDTATTVIDGNGVTIAPTAGNNVTLTDKGLNNGNNQVTNVSSGLADRDGKPVSLENATGDVLTNAVNVGDLKDSVNNLTNATTGGFGLTDENGKGVKADLGKTVTVKGDGSVKTNVVTDDNGKSALEISLNKDVTVGDDKEPGTIIVKGENGKDGVSINGKDGSIGLTGPAGKDGKDAKATISVKDGAKGIDGNDGKDGESKTRIVYEKPDGETEEVATLNDGLYFKGDVGDSIAKKLNETLSIKGNLRADAAVTDKNLRVDNVDGELILKMAKSLVDLTNATFGSDTATTVIDGNGITISPTTGDKVTLTDKGLNNGNNQVTNVSSGLADSDGKPVSLENATGDVLTNAVNVGDLKDSVNNLTNATTGGFGLTDENGKDVKADLGKTVTVKGDGSVKTNVVTDDNGKSALEISLNKDVTVGDDKEPGTIIVKGENGKDGVSINGKDGSIGLTGPAGKDGKDAQATISVKDGTKGLDGNDGKDGESKTRIVYEKPNGEIEEVATLNDGLKFVGNDDKVVSRKLNETLGLLGGLNATTVVNDTLVSSSNLGVRQKDDGSLELVMLERPSFSGLTVNGKDGKDPEIKFAKDGQDGMSIVGTRGADGQDGLTLRGKDGTDGISFKEDGRISNVTAGKDGKDAVNLDQLEKVNATANAGWNLQTNGGKPENVGPNDTVNWVNGDNINISNDGKTVTVGLVKDVDLGKDGSIKAGDTLLNNEGIKVGDNVSLSKDGLIAGDVKVSQDGIVAGDKQITKLASGLGNTKLADASGDTLTNAANIGDLKNAVSSVTDAEQGGGFGLADDNGTEVRQNLGKTIQVKGDGNIKTKVNEGALEVSLNKEVDLGQDGRLTTGNTEISDNRVGFKDSKVNLSNQGLDNGGNKVVNVAKGEVSATSTDAVNGSQLHETNQNVTNVQNEVAKGWNIEASEVKGSTGKVQGASKAKVAMGDTLGVQAGNNIVLTQNGANLAIATSANPGFDTVTIGSNGNRATISTVEDQYGQALNVAGANGSATRITNVAPGKADFDAVNVSQLKGVAQSVVNVDNRVSKLDKRVRGIGANSAAASSLPQVYIPGKSMVAISGGAYGGASALAVGYSKASDNGKIILKMNGTANSAGHYSGGVGVGYQW
ncbi:hypothetical protein A4G20_10515 [Pasteurellaceae bacterium RH1A]|nr:hypothetical protein A4G20_10515 [Pasteurellaceae bacterium RH1A]